MESLPKSVVEDKSNVESIFLRTVIREDVYTRLKEFAQVYSTGQGHWDFGISIQILLDFYDEQHNSDTEKFEMILSLLTKKEEEKKPEDTIELLGGQKIQKGEI